MHWSDLIAEEIIKRKLSICLAEECRAYLM